MVKYYKLIPTVIRRLGQEGGNRKGAEGVGSLGACGIEGYLRAGVG